ncbi:hypothetical protein [Pontibacter sp. G13]|uniref:hypothetical protein n=1 Tax=Pontibacter sp. G13 TaxID=3074898 RepID=UPI0028891699|nr:hypothetical protein [Pontibacter sp. G13]WNJ18185.1 hypothetical protein RJD25_25320 [Pontibacter sp. G13]
MAKLQEVETDRVVVFEGECPELPTLRGLTSNPREGGSAQNRQAFEELVCFDESMLNGLSRGWVTTLLFLPEYLDFGYVITRI